MIDGKNINIEQLNDFMSTSMSGYLEMEVIEVGDNFLKMKMPVSDKTRQPFGILDGGASMALAETAASLAGNLMAEPDKRCVGLEINGNHIKAIKSGFVVATASPIHLGKTTQIWQIVIHSDKDALVCMSRMTLAVIDK